ncbi:mannose-6-phosphate isomerase, class I [Marisediminicola senii]|uniref:mannose-6-phosphate isomerase, class I n=1 Tax=Marisediminicola senii TaxID=2711233 RepID=UPI0013EBF124|nr:mannose-6-phosphate isomerase, class I [Marisediminicola senii]
MFVGITNTPRPYAWGSRTAIAELLGTEASTGPEAELWLGAHEGSPSRLVHPDQAGGANDLVEWIAADPETTLGRHADGGRLPFLLKVLAADSPLSLQAHPTIEQAREGFDRENALGIPLDAPHRNYKDRFPKPELIVAVSETFQALCGFRPTAEFRETLAVLRDDAAPADAERLDDLLDRAGVDAALPGLVEWLSSGGPAVDELVSSVTARVASRPQGTSAELDTARLLADEYPGDPGIVISLMLNNVTLRRGEALYLPAGNIHAYLSGLGIELMAASDNVLRGGLTPKHVDVPELLSVLDFTPVPVPYLDPERPQPGVEVFRPDVSDFVLVRFELGAAGAAAGGSPAGASAGSAAGSPSGDGVDAASAGPGAVSASYALDGPAIALCTAGSVRVAGAASTILQRGESVYITPDEGAITVTGDGELFLATTGS